MADVVINIKPLLKLAKIPKTVFNQWAKRYRSFAALRFSKHSRGMGDWKKLAPATIARRREGKGTGPKTAILWDTGTLIGGLAPTLSKAKAKGGSQALMKDGVIVAYSYYSRHPKGGGMTVGRLADIHHFGLGVPKREIMVTPDQKTLDAMAGDVANYWRKTAK